MNRPVIGIPLRSMPDERGVSMEYLFEKVRIPFKERGAIILPIPYVHAKDIWKTSGEELSVFTKEEKEELLFFLEQCDGLFLPGGDKFTEQDRIIIEEAIQRKIPLLASCVGMQAVSCCGQEVKLKEIASNINHLRRRDCKYAHTVKVEEGSLLYRITGKSILNVNSLHKREVYSNPRFLVTARSEDGVIEALELDEDMFFLAVQWHPELMWYDLDANKILDAFYEATLIYQKHKKRVFQK